MSDADFLGVFPPGLTNPLWRMWLEKQDATKRRFVKEPTPGYWLLHRSLMPRLQQRCVEVGWMVYNNRPDFVTQAPVEKLESNPFSVFFLLPTAPKEVVDAVYRQLIKQSHTDIGGDQELAVLYNNTRDDIYRLKGW